MSEGRTVTTEAFTTSANGYVWRVACMWLGRWWWAVLLPTVACTVAALWEPMWLFAALMTVFFIYPALSAFIYFNYALTKEARGNVLPHTVSVDAEGVEEHWPESGETRRYGRADIKDIEEGRKSVTIVLKKPRYNHVYVPLDAVKEDERGEFMGILEKLAAEWHNVC